MVDDNTTLGKGKGANPKAKKYLLITAGILVALLIGEVGAMHFTSQPNFCASCHEITPQVASWSAGPHHNIPCLDCHANPGTVGYVSRKLKSWKEVYLHFSNQVPAKIEAQFNIETCKHCHMGGGYPGAKDITQTSGPLAPAMPHAAILQGNISCLNCHNNAGHDDQADQSTG